MTFAVGPVPPVVTQDWAQLKRLSAKDDVGRIGSRGIGEGFNLYSMEKEAELGRELAKQAESDVRLLNDPVVIEYVNRLTQNLARHSDAKLPITVKIIDSDEVNIFTLPGGFLFVNTGCLLAVESEAELAGAIAHEIAHTAARHPTKTESRKRMLHSALLPFSLLTGGATDAVIEPMAFTKFSRDAEREADFLGLQYTYAAGYDPAELIRFFERIRIEEGEYRSSFVSKLLQTHPMTEQRIRRARQEIKTILPPRNAYIITTSDFDKMKARLGAIAAAHRAVRVSPTHTRVPEDRTP